MDERFDYVQIKKGIAVANDLLIKESNDFERCNSDIYIKEYDNSI